MSAVEILKRPYARILIPESDGRFTAEIMEFPGCVAFGDNQQEALRKLEEVAVDWIDATIEQGQEVPEPMDSADFSGKLVLRMTRGLHKRAVMCAEREGVSLNQFITTCLAEAVGERSRPPAVYALPPLQAVANKSFLGIRISGTSVTPTRLLDFEETSQITAGPDVIGVPFRTREPERQRA